MSFKLFLLQLTGRLQDAGKIEARRNETAKLYGQFLEAEASDELKEYRELEKWIKSGDLQAKKKESDSLVFRGSEEYNQLKEFEELRKSKPIRDYFRFMSSGNLEKFEMAGKSEELKSFWELKEYIEEGAFEQEKKEIESHCYKGSAEQKQIDELRRLKKSRPVRAYLSLAGSQKLAEHIQFRKSEKLRRYLDLKNAPERDKAARKEFFRLKLDREIREYFRLERSVSLKLYREIRGSHTLKRFEDLVHLTGRDEFTEKIANLKDRKKLQKSEAWNKYLRFKELKVHPEVVFYRKTEDSTLYKNYLEVRDSFQLERYLELKELTASAPFLERKAFLEDKKKWKKTEEYAREQKFLRLKEDPKVKIYYRHTGTTVFDFFKFWEVSFSDEFMVKGPDRSRWTPNSYWADRLLGDRFSQPGDLQAYTGGKNSVAGQGRLLIQVRKEKAQGKQWRPDIGFVPMEFGYTSDTLSTIHSFWQGDGIVEAKVRLSPVKQVVHSFHLLGEKTSPQVTLVEMGPKCRMGMLASGNSPVPRFTGAGIGSLSRNKFYLFRIEREGRRLTWKINDKTVTEAMVPEVEDIPMHLNLTSLVVDEIGDGNLPVSFEISWIRCYRRKA